jgi:GxxExxY protein
MDLPHSILTESILKCCFEVMRELGCGFLESVYRNALVIALRDNGLKVEKEKSYEIFFRKRKIGFYIADLIVDELIVVELKCCKTLLSEHQAQIINYLVAADLPVGLLINFGHRNLQYKRICHPMLYPAASEASDPAGVADPVIF